MCFHTWAEYFEYNNKIVLILVHKRHDDDPHSQMQRNITEVNKVESPGVAVSMAQPGHQVVTY